MTATEATVTPASEDWLWWRWAALVLYPGHLAVTAATIGVRGEHLLLDGAFLLLAWSGREGRRFTMLASPFLLGGILYDNFHLFEHLRGRVHVADLYNAEKALFAVPSAAGPQILPEYFAAHHNPVLDLLCGLAYAVYIAWPPVLGIYLFFRDRTRMAHLAWAFFAIHIIGTIAYLAYPAAPPWYVEHYGLGPAIMDVPSNPAGALRFDQLTGLGYFESFYARSSNVFGAMPSLHVAYTVIALCAVTGLRGALPKFAFLFAVLVSFSAVYLSHHYVLDVVMGALTGVVGYGAVVALHRTLTRTSRFTSFGTRLADEGTS